ncbi:MAG: TlpA family protein disulfide reductase [Brevinematia bacterium]
MRILISNLLLIMLIFSCNKKNDRQASEKSQKDAVLAYNFSTTDISGKNIELSSFRGRVVLLNFWATWCPPCKAEIPDLNKLQTKYSNSLVIIGVSVDQEGVDVVKDFYNKLQIVYPVVMATEEIIAGYGGISAIPTSFVINHKGQLVGKIVGYRNFSQYEEILLPYMEKANDEGKN